MSKTKIIFVDDEPNVLAAIRRMLRYKRNEWDMYFAGGGPEALEEFKGKNMDVIVTDIRMPGMDGSELLERIRADYPGTVRIALSGQVDLEDVIKSIRAVHQYITKPCQAAELVEKVEDALKSREVLTDPGMQQMVTRIQALPVIPSVFRAIEDELNKQEPSMRIMADLISQDIGLVAKILMLVNSPYFGLPQNIRSIFQAITLLGIDTIKTLILSTHLFSEYEDSLIPGFSLQRLWDHSFRVSNIAKLIAECEHLGKEMEMYCRMAGILHDIGKLILANAFPDDYAKAINLVNDQKIPLYVAEKAVFDTTHAQLGAYLMGLWGLPGRTIQGIGYHHLVQEPDMSVPVIVSVADVIDHNCIILNPEYFRIELNESLTGELFSKGYLEKWVTYVQEHWTDINQMPGFNCEFLNQREKM